MSEIKNLKVNLEASVLNSDKVIIVPHNNIDFDAIGASIGLSVIADKLSKPSYIVVNDPAYKMDYGAKLVMEEAKNNFQIINRENCLEMLSDNDLFVLADVNKSYLISMSDRMTNKEKVIVIDHHEEDSKSVLSDYKYIDPFSSSTCEIVCKLLNLFKIKITSDVANYLLAGIHLDTNRLSKNTTPDTFRIVSNLMEKGASFDKINEWFIEDFNSDRRVQELVSKVKMYTYKIGIIEASEDDEYTREELAKAADYLLKYGVDASFAIGNIDDSTISISARSSEKTNVGAIMKELGGGGNCYSAAAKVSDSSIEEIGKRLIKTIKPNWYIK